MKKKKDNGESNPIHSVRFCSVRPKKERKRNLEIRVQFQSNSIRHNTNSLYYNSYKTVFVFLQFPFKGSPYYYYLESNQMATLGGVHDSQQGCSAQNSVEIEGLARFAVEQHNKKEVRVFFLIKVFVLRLFCSIVFMFFFLQLSNTMMHILLIKLYS